MERSSKVVQPTQARGSPTERKTPRPVSIARLQDAESIELTLISEGAGGRALLFDLPPRHESDGADCLTSVKCEFEASRHAVG